MGLTDIRIACNGFSLSDLSIDATEDKSHPNRLPFQGALLIVDSPSDQAPHGSSGHPILVPRSAAEKLTVARWDGRELFG